jgi:uncharacterized membrane protein
MQENERPDQPDLIPVAASEKRDDSKPDSPLHLHHHQNTFSPQFNVNLPSQVSLPSADELNRYSDTIQIFIAEGAQREQLARIKWVDNEQNIRLDKQRGDRRTQQLSMFYGTAMVLFIFGIGGWLVYNNKPFFGTAAVFTGVGVMVTSVIYGRIEAQKAKRQDTQPGSPKKPEDKV